MQIQREAEEISHEQVAGRKSWKKEADTGGASAKEDGGIEKIEARADAKERRKEEINRRVSEGGRFERNKWVKREVDEAEMIRIMRRD